MKSSRTRKIRDRWIALILTLVMVITILPSNAINSLAEAVTGNFAFIVTNEESAPVEGATVTITLGEEELGTGTTDANGQAILEVTYDGTEENPMLSYTVEQDGYGKHEATDAIDTSTGWTRDVTVTLSELLEITESDYSVGESSWEYDAQLHEFIVSADGFDVQYGEYNEDDPSAIVYGSEPFSLTNVGEAKISVKLSKEGYADLVLEPIEISVTKATADKFAFEVQDVADIVFETGLTFTNIAKSSCNEEVNVTYTLKETAMETIAQVDSSTGEVSFLTPGSITVVATMDAGQAVNYENDTVEYSIAALDPATLIHFTTSTEVTVTYGENNNSYKNEVRFEEGLNSDGYDFKYKITFESRDDIEIESSDNVADIDAEGNVTIYTAGKVTVQLILSKDGEEDIELSYDLIINRAELTDFAFETATPDDIVFGNSYTNCANSLIAGEGNITYSIKEGSEYISFDMEVPGKVIAIAPGTAVVTATREADDCYEEMTIEYEITVVQAEQTDFEFVFENSGDTGYKVAYGTETLNVLTTTGSQSTGSVTYYIDPASSIATIDEETGVITFNSQQDGTFTVRAVKAGDANYKDKEITCEVTVSRFDGTNFIEYDSDVVIGSDKWNTEVVEIRAKEGYTIARSDAFDANWSDSVIISSVEANVVVYVKNDTTGAISSAIEIGAINVDTEAPSNLSVVDYENSLFDIVIGTITFETALEVTLSATDTVSGIKYFKYRVGGEEYQVNADELTFEGNVASYTFTVSPFYKGNVSFEAVDNAGNKSGPCDSPSFIIDASAPAIKIVFDNDEFTNDKYYSSDRTATITIIEDDFNKENVTVIVGEGTTENNIEARTITLGKNDFVYDASAGGYVMTYAFDEDGYYTLQVVCSDAIYTTTENVSCFAIDKTAPIVDISYDKTAVVNKKYYGNNVDVTITITEHNFDATKIDGFAVKGYDVNGNVVNLSGLGITDLLQKASNWTHNGDVHTITLTLSIDANYTLTFDYADLAGNYVANELEEELCVDKVKPEITITYREPIIEYVLQTITFGFYDAKVEVTISASDETSGIDYIVYSYTVDEGVSSINQGGSGRFTYSNEIEGSVSPSFTIESDFRGKVSAIVYDKAGNFDTVGPDMIVVDMVAPGITVLYSDNEQGFTEGYYNADRTATIRINEANFFADSLYDSITEGVEACLKITVEKVYHDGAEPKTDVLEPVFEATDTEDEYEAVVEFTEEADYTFTITFTDLSGHKTEYSKTFTIDKTVPVVSVSYDNNECVNEKYFKAQRTATIQITEHNFDAEHIVSGIRVEGNEESEKLETAYLEFLCNAGNWKSIGNDTYEAQIVFDEDANYTFDLECSDKAGNNNKNAEDETVIDFGDSVAAREFTIDTTRPTGEIQISWPGQDAITTWNSFIDAEEITFDLSDNETLTVVLNNADNLSGLQEVKYFVSSIPMEISDLESENNITWVEVTERDGSFSFDVNPERRFIVYVYIRDMAGNELYISSNGIILDSTLPDVEKAAPLVITKPTAQPVNGIYSDDVQVDVIVKDPMVNIDGEQIYSGIKVIEYKVYIDSNGDGDYDADEQITQSGVLYQQREGDVIQSFPSVGSEEEARITVDKNKNNSNDVVVEIIATDNAGNSKIANCNLKIDITEPTVQIKYSDAHVDSDKYFNEDRVATIIVTERNFSANDVKVVITNSEGVIPKLTEWKKIAGSGNGDDTTWTATVTYSSEGDYTFDIAVKDLGGLVATNVDYGNSIAPTEFTIDKTSPTISVVYDNNSVENGMYYKDDRTATIIIHEHNFNPDRVTVSLSATNDGVDTTVPVVSNWVSDGDRHVATIQYDKDAVYTFDISVNDFAGNSAVDFAEQTFCVDKTDPELNISGIGEFSANNGTVAPIIEYSDTNYDAELVSVTLVGANRGNVDLIGNYENIHNGRKFIFANFAEEKEIDDIYTLSATIRDKAGREVSKTLTFSVNRFGSTYALDTVTEEINGSYVKEPIDIVLTEVNANELSNIEITLFKNNKTITLVEGEDYSIQVSGGDGEWYQYVYTIFKSNFEEDGIYRLSIYSEDAAGNIADNTLDTKNMEINFGIDKSAPAIVVMGLESGETYDVESQAVKLSVNDNLLLANVLVYIDGQEVAVNNPSDGEYEFNIPGDSTDAHEIKIVCIDAAGNETVTIFDDVRVTTDQWTQFVTSPVALYGSIAGVVILIGVVVFIIVYLKKRKK